MLFAIFMILFILWGFSAFCKSEKERLSFRDSLIQYGFHNQLLAGDDVFQLDQDQTKALYHFLDIDHRKETDTKKEADNDEWSMFYSNQDGQFVMKHYAADTSYQISISNSTETMTYQIDHKIGSIHEFLKQDMQSWYGFDDTHPIISNLKEVGIQKEKNLLYEYSISKSDLMSHEAVLIEDTTYQFLAAVVTIKSLMSMFSSLQKKKFSKK